MTSAQVAHDLAVAIVSKETSDPSVAVEKYLDLYPQIRKIYETEMTKRGFRTAVAPR